MAQVKTFNVTGYIKKRGQKISFTKDVRALKESDVLERIYSEMGSRHKAKRFDINVTEIKESHEKKESK